MGPIEIFCISVVIFLLLYYYCTSTFDFWTIRGVRGPKPLPFLGNLKDVFFARLSFGNYLKIAYDEFKNEPMVGIFARRTPFLLLRDPDLIKDILIKDFTKFADRGMKIHEKVEPLTQHLFNLEHARWRPLRSKLSPAFTSGKLREMFYLLLDSSDHLEKYLEIIVSKNEPIECRDLTSKFTIDVIGSCVFGINTNALCDEETEFLKMGKKIFQPNFWGSIKLRIRDATPWLYDLLGPIMKDRKMNNFYKNLFTETMRYRKENNVVRHDFVDLLKDIKEHPKKIGDFELTDDLITAQAFVFFVAGFETSSTTMSHALYELALNTSIQDKLRSEIYEELKKTDGVLTFDGVKNMKYLQKIFNETLRKYPPATLLIRQSTEKYTLSGTNVTIPVGQTVLVPVYALQRDPKNYPDAETFDPERFDEEAVKARHPMLFLSFGDGPRNCIGARFAVMQAKVGLIKMLKNFKVDVCEKSPIPYVINPRAFLLAPLGGMHLKFTKVS